MSRKPRPDGLAREADAVIVDHPDHCVVCHSCELACSYHHLSLFQPSRSSVGVERDADNGTITRRWYLAADEARIACDFCASGTGSPA